MRECQPLCNLFQKLAWWLTMSVILTVPCVAASKLTVSPSNPRQLSNSSLQFTEELEISGAERNSFYPIVESLAEEFRLAIRPDSHPQAGHFYRSDHFSLAHVGIPSFSINEGMKYKRHNLEWGMQQAEEFTNKHYHQPSDEYSPSMDFTGDATIVRFGFAVGWAAASQPKLIEWQKGDEFEKARLRSEGLGR